MTERQIAYRDYLQTDHWKALRDSVVERDGGKCVVCDSADRIQVHHKRYRKRFEDSLPGDLETLCRKCHGLEHGYGITDFELKCHEIHGYFGHAKRPPASAWKEMSSVMISHPYEMEVFGNLMFQFVLNVVAHEQEGFAPNWWMDKEKNYFWFKRAHNVRKSIKERIANVR